MDLLREFKNNWQKKFASRGRKILLAVSGGSDSMVMCDLFFRAGMEFAIAHCNFQLRGAEADADEALVKSWAGQHQIRFFNTRFDTANIAQQQKTGIQEAARNLRYEWLENIRRDHRFDYIATAHHANDNVETLLMNLFRGTGMSGLHGIPERNGKIVRPLLFALKADIIAYANEVEVPYRDDASNASDKYLRNAVRLHILPSIEKYFPEATNRLNENIQRFAQSELLYRKELQRQLHKLVQQRGNDIYLPIKLLQKMEAAETLCYEIFSGYGFTSAQIPQLLRLVEGESGRYIESSSHRVIKNRDFLILTSRQTTATDFIQMTSLPAEVETAEGRFIFSVVEKSSLTDMREDVAYVDLEKISLPLMLRRWRTGDYFYPLGMGMKKKKLSRFFIDQKIPLHRKEQVWVVENDKKIVWVAGMRLDERFKIRPQTASVLKIEFKG